MHKIFLPLSPTLHHDLCNYRQPVQQEIKKSDECPSVHGLLTSSLLGLPPLCCWLFGGCHKPAGITFFPDGNYLERRSILINLKHKATSCFGVQTLSQIIPVKKKAIFQAHCYTNRPRAWAEHTCIWSWTSLILCAATACLSAACHHALQKCSQQVVTRLSQSLKLWCGSSNRYCHSSTGRHPHVVSSPVFSCFLGCTWGQCGWSFRSQDWLYLWEVVPSQVMGGLGWL